MARSFGLLETPGSNLERQALKHGVPADEEFTRIDKLPRRTWTRQQIRSAQRRLTKQLRVRGGTRELWADQAVALSEIGWYGGTVGGLRVSGGKTTVSFLAATMLPDCPRPLLVCPAKSIKTGKVRDAYEEERKHWRVRKDYTWIAYEHLQRASYADYLFNTRPGLLVLDEAHHAGRYNSSRTKRITDYLEAFPNVPVIVLTGSLIASNVTNDSLTLCYWARRQYTPLPVPAATKTRRYWKLALGVPQRAEPGALRRWCRSGEPSLRGVGRRYYETPGIVCSAGKNVIGTSLSATTRLVRNLSDKQRTAFDHIRKARLPNGQQILDADGANTWLVAQTLALGFYYVYDPEPPDDWLDAYRDWCAYCREHIADNDCKCYTEAQVKEHVAQVDPSFDVYATWERLRGTYKLQRRAVWLSNERLAAASEWMVHHKHGLVWTQFRAFGEALAAVSKRPYYGSGAYAKAQRRYITRHKPGSGAGIASIKVCSEDLNLQTIFNANLFVSPPATGAHIEQAIARTHRFGCAWPEVTAEFWIACAENRDNLAIARVRERAAAEMTGDSSRKLLIADWTQDRLTKLTGPQWAKYKIAKELMK